MTRTVPENFEERSPQVGWTGAESEWRAHARAIARWIDECGRTRMVAARKDYLAAQRRLRDRARRKCYRFK